MTVKELYDKLSPRLPNEKVFAGINVGDPDEELFEIDEIEVRDTGDGIIIILVEGDEA